MATKGTNKQGTPSQSTPAAKSPSGNRQPAATAPATVNGNAASVPLSDQRRFLLLFAIIAIATFFAYCNSFTNGYVLDDVMVLKDNKYVIQGMSALADIFSTPHMRGYLIIPNDLYRPFSLAVFAVEYQFFGANAVVGHIMNLVFYLLCLYAWFVFLRNLLGARRLVAAFTATLIFALHPIHTEVVSNIKSSDELLCFLFAIVSLNLFMKYMKQATPQHLALGCFTLFLSFLSKETVLTFLAVIPFLFFVVRKDDTKRAVAITVVSLVVAGVYLAIRAAVLAKYNANQKVPVEFIDNALSGAKNGVEKFATEVLIMGQYLRMMFVPYPLIANYSFNKIPFVDLIDVRVLATFAIYGGMVYYAVRRFRADKTNPYTFAILFFLATISLFSNFPFLMGAEMAERFTFFSSAGTCLMAGVALDDFVFGKLGDRVEMLKTGKPLAVLIPVCVIFLGITFMRNFDWKSNYELYKADVEKSPEDSRLNYYLGTAMAEGRYDSEPDTVKKHEIDNESILHLRKSLAIYPDYTEANAEIGRVFYREGKYDSAEIHDKKALSINPNHVTGNNNLGSVYLTLARYPEAIALFRKTVALDPSYVYAYFNMARAYMQLKKYDSAIYNFRMTLALNFANVDARQELGMAYYYLQNWDSAAVNFKKVLDLNPNDPNAINNLGAIYLNTKKYDEAIKYFQKSITINPGYINAYSNLARSYYFSGQYAKAIETIFNTLKIAPKYVNDVPYIALAYQKMGKMDSARKYEAVAKKLYSNFKLE